MAGDNLASMMQFLGISDPAVDPDGVRDIAKKWRALADAVDDAAKDAEKALADVVWEGKTAREFFKRAQKTRAQASKMADGLRDGADGLDKFANEAEHLLSELGVIVVEIIEVEMAGLALGVLTGGASTVVSTLAAGARFAKVMAIIARIEKAGTALGRTIRLVMETIRALTRALKALKSIKSVARMGKLAGEGAKFAALDALLKDPSTFKDPEKLAETLAMGAALGIGGGALGKLLGKGLGKLKPKHLSKLRSALKLNCSTLNRLKARPGWDKLPASVQNALKKFVRDPIDVATGDMALTQRDAELPGVLPLLLERTHLSSYRYGGWFGPSWASTIDQRLQIDEEGVVYLAADGSRLCFPLPDAETGEQVRPETPGSRLTLRFDPGYDGALHISDPETGLTYAFHSPVPVPGQTPDDEATALDIPLQYIRDRNGNRITLEYDNKLSDQPRTVAHSGGYRIALDHHESLDRIVRLRLLDPEDAKSPGTTLIAFEYDESGQLVGEINSSGLALRYTYDREGRITSWTDRNGTTYWYLYDACGRVIETGGTNDVLASTLTYDEMTLTTRVTDSLGHTRVYEHNEYCRLIRETDPLGNLTLREWDGNLQLIAVTDPLGHAMRYLYDDQGNVTRVVRPDGAEFVAEYNDLGLPTRMTNPDGTVSVREYSPEGNPLAVTDTSGHTTRFAFSEGGRLVSVINALGRTTSIRTDEAGLPIEVTDPHGSCTRWERDPFGRPVVITDGLGARTSLEWTVEGKPMLRAAADGSEESWLYDGEGNCIRHTDANGGVAQFEYAQFDTLSARTDPDGARYEFSYDSELRLREVQNPQGLSWGYLYDPAGRLIAETDFDERQLTYAYDDASRLTSRTNPIGQSISFERNAMGQVVRKAAVGQVTAYAYDTMGRMTQATGPGGATLALLRDSSGRLTSEMVDGREVTYFYDELGRPAGRRTPTGATTSWSYGPDGHQAQMVASGHTIDFTYDTSGREIARRIGETVALEQTFDVLGRLTTQSVTARDGRAIQSREYTYRADGNLIGLEDLLAGSRSFDLDPAGRVTAVHAANWTETYAYDAAGNQASASWPAALPGQEAIGERVYEGTRIRRAGNIRYEYDAAGRTILRQKARLSRKPDTWRYEWDAEDRLVQVTTPDGTCWRYTYDPLGRRTNKIRLSEDGETFAERVHFTWDGTTLCEQTTESVDQPDTVIVTWDYHGSRPLAQTERITAADAPQEVIDSRFYAIVTDLVGAPSELVDERGEIAWRARSTLWGATAWETESQAYTPLRFPGQYFDPETGLHYNYFRHYDPETARYTAIDPLGLAPGPNPAVYVRNPHTWTDPFGLSPCPEHLFRGTTRGFEGSPGVQRHGITPTSSDPGVATVFATQSERYGDAVVEIYPRRALDGVPVHEGYIAREAEWPVELSPAELSSRASAQIPSSTAREILSEMGISVPRRVDKGDIDPLLEYDVPKLSPQQVARFVEEAHKRA
ncbi:RHS repeat protein [Streptomyces sp. LD120]|uniref:RHS repeat protein n=2 Tax=Streptomyces physcomitrii TaxID=2724184 RepID=A0ABX1H009_9ACTN|nr:RHS repeat protein [Streptomyces physcomitrii]